MMILYTTGIYRIKCQQMFQADCVTNHFKGGRLSTFCAATPLQVVGLVHVERASFETLR